MKPYYDDGQIVIYHGDCREIDAWLTADVLITDPPYGMNFRSGAGGSFGDSRVTGDESTAARDAVLEWWPSRPALVFGRWSIPRPAGTRAVLVWDKGEHVGMGDLKLPWKPNTEEIYVLGHGFSGRRDSGVLRVQAIAGTVGRAMDGTRHHPTEKPVGLLEQLISKCPPDWTIADPFMGSGTTLRAAKNLGRRAIGVEIEENYCRVAVNRLAQQPMFAA